MNRKHVTLRVLATAALIFVVAGLSGNPTAAKTPGKVSTTALRLNGVQPISARPLTAMVVDDPEAIYEGWMIPKPFMKARELFITSRSTA